jgi:hypothetical protein
MPQPFYAVIIPLGAGGHPDQGLPGGPAVDPPYPDQGLPGRPPHVGNRPPGSWNPEYPSQGPVRPGRPVDPGFGWGGGEHPGNRPPGSYPGRPSTGPVRPGWPTDPGYGVGEEHPDQGLPPALGPIPPVDPWEPPPGEELPPPPAEIAHQVVIAVWRPEDQAWKVAVAQGSAPQ